MNKRKDSLLYLLARVFYDQTGSNKQYSRWDLKSWFESRELDCKSND